MKPGVPPRDGIKAGAVHTRRILGTRKVEAAGSGLQGHPPWLCRGIETRLGYKTLGLKTCTGLITWPIASKPDNLSSVPRTGRRRKLTPTCCPLTSTHAWGHILYVQVSNCNKDINHVVVVAHSFNPALRR